MKKLKTEANDIYQMIVYYFPNGTTPYRLANITGLPEGHVRSLITSMESKGYMLGEDDGGNVVACGLKVLPAGIKVITACGEGQVIHHDTYYQKVSIKLKSKRIVMMDRHLIEIKQNQEDNRMNKFQIGDRVKVTMKGVTKYETQGVTQVADPAKGNTGKIVSIGGFIRVKLDAPNTGTFAYRFRDVEKIKEN